MSDLAGLLVTVALFSSVYRLAAHWLGRAGGEGDDSWD